MTSDPKSPYQSPPLFDCLTLDERLAEEPNGYEPKWHAGTTVNDGLENFYESHLLPIEEACELLKGSVQGAVVRDAWEAICLRHSMEQYEKSFKEENTRKAAEPQDEHLSNDVYDAAPELVLVGIAGQVNGAGDSEMAEPGQQTEAGTVNAAGSNQPEPMQTNGDGSVSGATA
jgi:hypothetical protein